MTVIRVVHNKENPFVQLNKQALWNPSLSLKAIGLWARCMSRPDDWRFNIKELASKSKEGRRAIDSAIKELIEHGYAMRLEHYEKKEDGKFKGGGVEYIFFEFPATKEEEAKYLEEFKKSFRRCGFGDCRDGDCRNSNLLIYNPTDTDKKTETKSESSVPSDAPLPLYQRNRVKMDAKKYNKLCEDFGSSLVEAVIDDLDAYADINPKRFKQYACHAAVVRKWIKSNDAKKTVKVSPTGVGAKNLGEIEAENRTWRTGMEKILWQYIKEGKIYISPNYIEIIGHNFHSKLDIRDVNFISKCKEQLKLIGAMV